MSLVGGTRCPQRGGGPSHRLRVKPIHLRDFCNGAILAHSAIELAHRTFILYANRARRSERDHDFLQIKTAATAVLGSKYLGACLFVLIALCFKLRELLRSKDALGLLHEFCLGSVRTPRFVVFGHRRFHLGLLICCQVESRKRGRAGHLSFVPSLLGAIAMFTREHCSSCECACCH